MYLWILWLVLGILAMIIGIAILKIHPFIVITIVSLAVGLLMGMPLINQTGVKDGETVVVAKGVVDSLVGGMGGTLGELAFIIAFGVMMGKFLMISGGGHKISMTLIKLFGKKNLNWGIAFAAIIIGLPVFFDVGFLLLLPMVVAIAVEASVPLMFVAMPFLAGISVAHGLIPPHPAATFAVNALGANMGMTILIGIAIAIPSLAVAGPLYGKFISKYIPKKATLDMAAGAGEKNGKSILIDEKKIPSFWMSMSTILLPIFLMIISSILQLTVTDKSNIGYQIFAFLGSNVVALLIGAIYSFVALGLYRGLNMNRILEIIDEGLKPVMTVLLVTGAGGAFKGILTDSGISDEIAKLASGTSGYALLAISWGVAALIRISIGSSTASLFAAIGIVSAFTNTGVNPTLLALATGGGCLILGHVNDSGFWLTKSFFKLSIKETFLTWSMMETILSVMILIMCLLFNTFIPVSF